METSKGGFTLVELLIVIAVIGILAGVFFIGVTGFRNSALDARRIADLKNIQNALELYYSKCRLYPNANSNSATCPAASGNPDILQGSALETALISASIGVTAVPRDPVGTNPYTYRVTANGQNYVLAATLSGDRDVLRDPATITSNSTLPTGAPSDFYNSRCAPAVANAYCVGNR